jgi:hypothetical protein
MSGLIARTIGLSQSQQRRNRIHVMWRILIKKTRLKMDYRGPGWNPNTKKMATR